MSIADRIKNKREELGLSQAELARRSGLTPPGISQYEAGLRNPSYEALIKLAGALGVSTDYLVSGDSLEHATVQENTAAILNQMINNMTVENREKLLNYALFIINFRPRELIFPLLSSAKEYGDYIYKTLGDSTLPTNLCNIATKLKTSIIEDDLHAEAEGLLIRSSEKTYIVIDKNINLPQRKRFIIACLISHLVIPWHLRDSYMVRRKGVSTLLTEDVEEIEAQKFASCLLMPTSEVINYIDLGRPSLKEIKKISYERFDVSLFAFLNQLVDIDNNRFTVVQSSSHMIKKAYQGNRALLDHIYDKSYAYSFSEKEPVEEEFRGGEIPAEYWFVDAVPGEMIYEESVFNPEYKSVLTLLIMG